VSFFTPAFQSTTATGFGVVNSISLPTGSQPVFVTLPEQWVYVAKLRHEFGKRRKYDLNIVSTRFQWVSSYCAGGDSKCSKLYVANQGDNTVSSLNIASLSSNPVTVSRRETLTTPVWVVARSG